MEPPRIPVRIFFWGLLSWDQTGGVHDGHRCTHALSTIRSRTPAEPARPDSRLPRLPREGGAAGRGRHAPPGARAGLRGAAPAADARPADAARRPTPRPVG